MTMRSATRSSRIISSSPLPSTYSEWLRLTSVARVQIRLTAELRDSLGDLVHVPLLGVRVLEKLLGHAARVDSGRHVVVALVAQDAHDLGRERFVQDAQHRLDVGSIALGHRALLDVGARSPAELLDVGHERSRPRLDHE